MRRPLLPSSSLIRAHKCKQQQMHGLRSTIGSLNSHTHAQSHNHAHSHTRAITHNTHTHTHHMRTQTNKQTQSPILCRCSFSDLTWRCRRRRRRCTSFSRVSTTSYPFITGSGAHYASARTSTRRPTSSSSVSATCSSRSCASHCPIQLHYSWYIFSVNYVVNVNWSFSSTVCICTVLARVRVYENLYTCTVFTCTCI